MMLETSTNLVKSTQVRQTRLPGDLATSIVVCERELYPRNRKTGWRGAGGYFPQSELTKLGYTLDVTFLGLNSQKCQLLKFGQ